MSARSMMQVGKKRVKVVKRYYFALAVVGVLFLLETFLPIQLF